jgi:hypothetical protein
VGEALLPRPRCWALDLQAKSRIPQKVLFFLAADQGVGAPRRSTRVLVRAWLALARPVWLGRGGTVTSPRGW